MLKTKKTLTALMYTIVLSCATPATAKAADDTETKVESQLELHAENEHVQVTIKIDPVACLLALSLTGKKKQENKTKKT